VIPGDASPVLDLNTGFKGDQARSLAGQELGKLTRGSAELSNSWFDGDKTDIWMTFFAKSTQITFNLVMCGLFLERSGQHST